MSRLGARMIRAADEALAYAAGEASEGFVVHRVSDAEPEMGRRVGAHA